MEKKINRIKPFLRENAAPILLSAAVVSAVAYVYACGQFTVIMLFTFISLGLSFLLFRLYEWLRESGKTLRTTIFVTAALVMSMALGGSLNDLHTFNELTLWFMEPSRFTEVHYGSTMFLILTVGTVLISSLYYFTRVIYRRLFVFLICLCPFCLFAKTFTEIPVILPIVMMTLFFFIMMNERADRTRQSSDITGTMRSMLAFVLVVTVIASFFPKLENSPYRENFDEFITGVSIGTAGAADFTDFSQGSSNTTSRETDGTILFTLYGDNPKYIKRQCYDLYSLADNTWGYYGSGEKTGYDNWKTYLYFEDPMPLYVRTGFYGSSGTKNCWIRSMGEPFHALYTSDSMTDIELYNNDTKIYRTAYDEYFFDRHTAAPVNAYTLEWSEYTPDPAFSALFTDETAEEISGDEDDPAYTEARSYLRAKKDAVMNSEHLLSDAVMNGCYSSVNARTRVKELARQITDRADSTYEKAAAIVDYFRSGDYIYDNEFTAPDGSPDYFIFSSKRGACAAYATAMTLMCRELGMTARYCEGFLVQKYDVEGGYSYVTSADSHAFVQVWLDGYGWTTFDPTSVTEDNGYFDMTFIYVGAAAALAVAVGVTVFALRPRIAENRFRRRMKAAQGAAQYSMVYNRINSLVNRYIGNRENLLTPADTAAKCRELLGFDADGFVERYEAVIYGGAQINDDCSQIYSDFMTAYTAKLREDKKCRKQEKAFLRRRK
ncbi:MAG: transglutaminase domain-containing protein [Ruminiclostridium sp.]|nr:transglutaminase domain-containing protein [Ruminiclostridium sp.]